MKMINYKFNSIEEAIADFREGRFLIVADDEDRENEGDFIIAAEKITPEKINFMMTYGRGVLCAPITEERCTELELEMQVSKNTSIYDTPFTVTVDKLGGGCTTGAKPSRRWPIKTPNLPIWADLAISVRFAPVPKAY
jgi:3,4-dihydroxy 2-butanone 4-phosphate synthase/GTP cyclohydrolase II